jgi:hypothetical protein
MEPAVFLDRPVFHASKLDTIAINFSAVASLISPSWGWLVQSFDQEFPAHGP